MTLVGLPVELSCDWLSFELSTLSRLEFVNKSTDFHSSRLLVSRLDTQDWTRMGFGLSLCGQLELGRESHSDPYFAFQRNEFKSRIRLIWAKTGLHYVRPKVQNWYEFSLWWIDRPTWVLEGSQSWDLESRNWITQHLQLQLEPSTLNLQPSALGYQPSFDPDSDPHPDPDSDPELEPGVGVACDRRSFLSSKLA